MRSAFSFLAVGTVHQVGHVSAAMKTELDLNLLPVLEALITEASVSGAAERLDMTQSAVSHALRRLRLYFNDPLFVRAANRMLPTPRLQALEPFIRMTMEGLRTHLDPSSEFDPSKSSRNFTISSSDLGELVFLPAILGELRRQAPRCRVRVVSIRPREIKAALEGGEIDLLIGSQRLRREGLYQQQLLHNKLVCVASRTRYSDISAFSDVDRFAALPHVAISPYGEDEDVYDWAFHQNGIVRRFVCTTTSSLVIPFLVESSDVVATVPEPLSRYFAGRADLRTVSPPVELPRTQIGQTWHPRYHTDAANVWLRRIVFSLFGSGAATKMKSSLSED